MIDEGISPIFGQDKETNKTSSERGSTAYYLLGFEEENLGVSPAGGQLLPKQTEGTTQILIIKNLRAIRRPALYITWSRKQCQPLYVTICKLGAV